MHALGFEVALTRNPYGPMPAGKILAEVRNRETSQLVLLDDERYAVGLAALERDVGQNQSEAIETGLTLVSLVGRKSLR